MAGEQKHNSPLKQFILLAKNTKGPALITLINQLLEAPGVYVYGEFLDLPHVQEISKGPSKGYSELLNIFAYGTYLDYKENEVNLPPLTDLQKNKLRQLTFVSLAGFMQCIPYSMLLRDLELRNLRQLEDLVIDAIYADIIHGKLDQRRQLLELEACIGRDIRPGRAGHIACTLQEWCSTCWSVMNIVELQVDRVSQFRARRLRVQQLLEAEVSDIQKLLITMPVVIPQNMDCSVEQEGARCSTDCWSPLRKASKEKGQTHLRQ